MNYRFNAISLDTESLELRHEDVVVPVEPQVFSVLTYLIENRDRVVGKDELIEAVWDGRAISDGALNSRINAARKAVGDNGKTQAVIKTFPRRGFRWVAELTDESNSDKQDGAVANLISNQPSIAVLPFENLSNDSEQEYFSDGITGDIITSLSRIRQLLIIARNTTFTYKNQPVNIQTVARDLAVRYVLEGSVRKAGNRVRISAQLIDGNTGQQLWAERYDRELEDIFNVQDEITEAVTGEVSAELDRAEGTRARGQAPENLDAWTSLQKGISFYNESQATSFQEAESLFKHCIEFDPNFALGHAWLGLNYCRKQVLGFDDFQKDAAFAAAQTAIELDRLEPIAHFATGWCQYSMQHDDTAVKEFEQALNLNPNLDHCRQLLARTLARMSLHVEAIEQYDLAMKISPRGELVDAVRAGKALSLLMLKDYEGALEWARRAVQSPRARFVPAYIVSTLGHTGKTEEAKIAIEEMKRLRPEFTYAYLRDKLLSLRGKDRDFFMEGLRKAGLTE